MNNGRPSVGDTIEIRDITGQDHAGVILAQSDSSYLVLATDHGVQGIRRKSIVSWTLLKENGFGNPNPNRNP